MVESLHLFSHLDQIREFYQQGLRFLLDKVQTDTFDEATPIGLYFAKLWYYEKLYPVIFTTAALGRKISS